MARHPSKQKHTIWQWNCRSYKNKRAHLQQYLKTIPERPDVIILQETNGPAKLSGYQSIPGKEENPNVTTLVKRELTVIEHDTHVKDIENVLVELIPPRKTPDSIFVLNVYSSPRCRKHRFHVLFKRALDIAQGQQLFIGGDFNAVHTVWD